MQSGDWSALRRWACRTLLSSQKIPKRPQIGPHRKLIRYQVLNRVGTKRVTLCFFHPSAF